MHTVQTAPAAPGRAAAPRPDVIRLEKLHKVYVTGANSVHALRGVDLAVPEGQFLAIMGASGSGKSTMLNVLGCLDVPTSGDYLIDGSPTSKLNNEELAALRNSRIGFIFQNFNLLTRSTALENVELPMIYGGINAVQRLDRARAALARVGLADRMEHLPWQLSGGQQQRVAIARALANEPRILLADEPTGNLDTHTSAEIMAILTNLHEEDGRTVVLVTHDPGVASFAERVVALKDGEIVVDQPTPRCGGPELPNVRALTFARAER
ncbi:MAG: ABC transporter ATP-binding protein [Phycisphaerae bacterium]|nr:ABC transporter ATP-binding protein [Phycisphaerae bacterium]NUQ44929.1 ABC transporter ATP-binding protein [Phycisphaerae bacterium]